MVDTDLPDLGRVLAFYEVARTGSVGAAALRLGRSQPAISHRLRGLARELGVEPFELVGRRLVLTPAGRELFGRVEHIVALARDLAPDRAGVRELRGRVRVGTLPTVAAHLLPRPFSALLARHPTLGVTAALALSDVLSERLRSGDLDVALFVGAKHTAGFALELVGRDRLVLVTAPSRGRRRTPAKLSAADLRGRRYLGWGGVGDETFDAAHAWATANGCIDETTPFVPNIAMLREMVALDAGWTLLPRYTVADEVAAGRIVAHEPAGLTHSMEFLVARRRGQPDNPALGAVLAMLREATATLSETPRRARRRSRGG
jgi:DNA-binding transcriptional LysR family regulator